jgi:hypothetical protein
VTVGRAVYIGLSKEDITGDRTSYLAESFEVYFVLYESL